MRNNRARRPQPAISEQKAGQQRRAQLAGRKAGQGDDWVSSKAALGEAGRGKAGAAKPAGTRGQAQGKPADTAAQPPTERRAPVKRAKKLQVRAGSQLQVAKQKQLREKRIASDQLGEERLQKALAFSGWGSRREVEGWIAEGKVTINGRVAELGAKVKPGDDVRVGSKRVALRWPDRLPRVVLYHKQEGELVTRDDPQGRVTVFERLPKLASSKWIAIGRLDFNTSGLLVFTTSGDLANHMTHPRFEIEREYAVRVLGELSDEQIAELKKGIELDDGPAHFEHITPTGGEGANHWYNVVLKEGRNREVRRMFEHYQLQVSRLMRVRFGMFGLPPRLKRGQFYELNETEVLAVMKWADLKLNGEAKD
ncbi:pseudouridine synthase [Chitinolyticbacter meiyuanensis]|uniref:pseudouridine synthase n=1 Tax=Chitinolyticbacter meiyuanensis TaxID=682798 RepID=UPI001652A6A2|nr:pseudouridine synthase [Chitinolyticbacter meiyuanensis]